MMVYLLMAIGLGVLALPVVLAFNSTGAKPMVISFALSVLSGLLGAISFYIMGFSASGGIGTAGLAATGWLILMSFAITLWLAALIVASVGYIGDVIAQCSSRQTERLLRGQ